MSSAHEPTPETRASVASLAKFGIPQDQIARHIGVDAKTLRLHYRVELDNAAMDANLEVAKNLFSFASGTRGDFKAQVTAGIFWAKTRMGWREQVDVNHNHTIVDGARDRLAAKLGAKLPAQPAEGRADLPPAIGRA